MLVVFWMQIVDVGRCLLWRTDWNASWKDASSSTPGGRGVCSSYHASFFGYLNSLCFLLAFWGLYPGMPVTLKKTYISWWWDASSVYFCISTTCFLSLSLWSVSLVWVEIPPLVWRSRHLERIQRMWLIHILFLCLTLFGGGTSWQEFGLSEFLVWVHDTENKKTLNGWL